MYLSKRLFTLRKSQGFLLAILSVIFLVAVKPAFAKSPTIYNGSSPAVVAWVYAVNGGNIEAISKMYDGDSTVYSTDAVEVKGRENIVKSYKGMFDNYKAAATVTDAHYIENNGLLYSWGRFTLTLTPKGGSDNKIINASGRFSDLTVKKAGTWTYIQDHASADPK